MKDFIIVIVSPLDYIRQQQVANVARTMCGVRAAAIGESEENDKELSEGKYNIVYGSAEQWLNPRWKKCLQYGGLRQTKYWLWTKCIQLRRGMLFVFLQSLHQMA